MELGVRAIRTKYDGDGLLADDARRESTHNDRYDNQLRALMGKGERPRETLD